MPTPGSSPTSRPRAGRTSRRSAIPSCASGCVPKLPFGAQRPLNSDVYYPTFNAEHVTLITDPIGAITPRGVRTADGIERPVDVLVLATGYEANRFLSVIDVAGRDGLRLADVWEDGPHAYRGVTVAGFPNLFMLYGPNTNTGSILTMLEHEADYILAALHRMERDGLDWLEVRQEAMDAYNATLQEGIAKVDAWREVGSRYYRHESGRIVTQFPGNMAAFSAMLAEPDDDAYIGGAVARQEPAVSG